MLPTLPLELIAALEAAGFVNITLGWTYVNGNYIFTVTNATKAA